MNILSRLKIPIGLLIVLAIGYFISEIPGTTRIDFSTMRQNLTSKGIKSEGPEFESQSSGGQFELSEEEIKSMAERDRHVSESRARQYVESATTDYYQGYYDDALRRLDRARIYDPSNFSIFKLSGQIFFEKNKYRKAFNDWERANQLPNDDRTISRDLDVLKKLIRYSRTEIDRLNRTLYREPGNQIARARLKELEDQMRE